MKQEHKQQMPVTFEEVFSPARGVVQEFPLPFSDKPGTLKIALVNDIGVVDSHFCTDRITPPWEHINHKSFVEMNFMVEGSIYQTMDGFFNRHRHEKGTHNILFNPGSLERNELVGYGCYRTFGIHIVPEKMIALLTAYMPEFEQYATKIAAGTSFTLESQAPLMTAKMKYIFDTIWQTPDPVGLKKLYIESKVLDLLSLQWASLLSLTQTKQKSLSLSASEIDKLHIARTIIESRLDNPPSLAVLSKLCQLNEFKLKKGFRELFNTSVFGYVSETRLDRARKMIAEGEKNISEIAWSLGYSHPQHFQRAFKKHYGITPGSLLK
ncbi:AraC family transcriptional regulator [Chitinophaga sp. MM2321]|uniref:helix-turn-helix transcriptional regulator n=1 Tax=Chitinophaga sp. MM2321 TaxID=3137178 RepID=UPI0032D56846